MGESIPGWKEAQASSVGRKVGDVLNDAGEIAGEVWAELGGVSLRDRQDETVDNVEPATARGLANLLKRAADEVEDMRDAVARADQVPL